MFTSKRPLETIFLSALAACEPARLVAGLVEPRDGDTGFAIPRERLGVKLAAGGRLWVFGAGKASASMAAGLLEKLGPQIAGGVLIAPQGAPSPPLGVLDLLRGTHPDASSLSQHATAVLLAALVRCKPGDHALFVLSGGASSLLLMPVEGFTVTDKRDLARALMAAGAPIDELNCVRRHLSTVKGGGLFSHFRCGVTALVLSDVVGNALQTIGSGPLWADRASVADAAAILDRRLGPLPLALKARAALVATRTEPTGVAHVFVGDGAGLAAAALRECQTQFECEVVPLGEPVTGEVEAAAERLAGVVRGTGSAPRLLVGFGEPVVRLRAGAVGVGGRAQHLALELAMRLEGFGREWEFLSAGSDGVDGCSKAAGAIASNRTTAELLRLGIDPRKALAEAASDGAFSALIAQVLTGPTGNNLGDLQLLWVK